MFMFKEMRVNPRKPAALTTALVLCAAAGFVPAAFGATVDAEGGAQSSTEIHQQTGNRQSADASTESRAQARATAGNGSVQAEAGMGARALGNASASGNNSDDSDEGSDGSRGNLRAETSGAFAIVSDLDGKVLTDTAQEVAEKTGETVDGTRDFANETGATVTGHVSDTVETAEGAADFAAETGVSAAGRASQKAGAVVDGASVPDIDGSVQSELASEIKGSVDAALADEIRGAIREDLVIEITDSLDLQD